MPMTHEVMFMNAYAIIPHRHYYTRSARQPQDAINATNPLTELIITFAGD